MGAVWSALLVGGGLAGAIFVWLLRDSGNESDAERNAPQGEAAAPGSDQGGGGGPSPVPSRRELVTKAGILPPTSRGQICHGGFEVHRGRKKTHLEFFSWPFPPTNLPYPGQDPPQASHYFPRLVRTRRAGLSPSSEAPKVPRPIVRGQRGQSLYPGRPSPKTPRGMGSFAWLRLAQCGRPRRRRRPFRALQRACLGSGRSYNPHRSQTEQGHFLSPNPITSRPPLPHPMEELGLGTNSQALSTSRYLDASVRKAKFRLDSGQEGLS